MGYAEEAVAKALDVETSTRICHLAKPGTGNSYCGMKPFDKAEAHDRAAHDAGQHRTCAVCDFEWRRLHA